MLLLDATDPWIRWDWVQSHRQRLLDATLQHVQLTAIALAVGIAIAAPVGIWAWRSRRFRTPVLAIGGALYTIPSLAAFALLVPFTGLTLLTAEIPLISYTLLILIRNIVVGLDGVPAEVREAATGMGYGGVRRLFQIELPLALPVILAGVRIATVTTVGLVTVTALIGEGGLGQLILDGLTRDFKTPIVIGAALSVALAAAADLALVGVQRLAAPWAR